MQEYPRRLFSREFRRRTMSIGIAATLVSIVPAFAGGWSAVWLARDGSLPLAALCGGGGILVAIAAGYVVRDRIGLRGYPGLREALAARFAEKGIDLSQARFVGYSPGSETAIFDGDTNFDLGFLVLTDDELRYYGDGLSFALPRSQIVSVRLGPPLQGIRRTAITWSDPAHGSGAMTIELLEVRTMAELRRACRPFAEETIAWWSGPPDAPPVFDSLGSAAYVRAYGGRTVPPFASATGLAHVLAFGPLLVVLLSILTGLELTTFGHEVAHRLLFLLILVFVILEQVVAGQVQRLLDRRT